jgi:hypothetical protein
MHACIATTGGSKSALIYLIWMTFVKTISTLTGQKNCHLLSVRRVAGRISSGLLVCFKLNLLLFDIPLSVGLMINCGR